MFNRFRAGLLTASFVALIGAGSQSRAATPAPGIERFYVGTYSGVIYQSTLNLGAGTFGTISQAVATTDPSFIAMTPNRAYLYSVNEGPATVSAFSVNATNGTLRLLNQMPSNGGAPAHIVVDRTGRNVIVANYNGGSVTVFPILTNGLLGAATAHIQHPGTAPHAHCITLDASNHFAFVCDKGLDQIRSYIFDAVAGTLTTNTTLITSVASGSGPRHMAFDPQFKRAYVICETASTILAFNFDSTNGTLASFQKIGTVPAVAASSNTGAEIVVHPSGKFVYGSNRGYNSVAVFSVDPVTGALTLAQQQITGATPRNFALDPTGAYCIVAGQDSGDIRLYTIDQQTGLLTDTHKKLAAASPVCILPFILTPPQPALTIQPTVANAFQLSLTNTLNLLTYQLYRSSGLNAGAPWSLLATGDPGQTNFTLTNRLAQEFFQVGVLTDF